MEKNWGNEEEEDKEVEKVWERDLHAHAPPVPSSSHLQLLYGDNLEEFFLCLLLLQGPQKLEQP